VRSRHSHSHNQITNLPVNGRDWSGIDLVGAIRSGYGGAISAQFVRGTAIDDNNFNSIVDARHRTSAEIASPIANFRGCGWEYHVNSALYDANMARRLAAINVVTKSAPMTCTASFGYLRNSVFDARNFTILTERQTRHPAFSARQYGLTVGGPIHKNKHSSFSATRIASIAVDSQVANVPSLHSRPISS